MNNDAELLRRYVAERSESAFSSLVTAYLDLVYATATRELGESSHLASDVAQQVFTTFARKASALIGHPTVAGWLHHTTRHMAQKTIRAERRRAARETEAYAMEEIHRAEESAEWKEIQPVIDWALDRLDHRDKEAVLRRFFRGQNFAEIGVALAVTEPAARMRVERALHKLRNALACRGISSTSAALSAALATHAAIAAPAGLATTVSAAAMTIAPAGGVLGLLTLMSITKASTSAIGILICACVVGVLLQQQTRAQLKDQLTRLQNSKAERTTLVASNERLSAANEGRISGIVADVEDLRARARALESQIAAATPQSAPIDGFVAADMWKKVGHSTPGEAFETLMAAMSSLDVVALGTSVTLTPDDRERAKNIFEGLSEDTKVKLAISNPEEMVAFSWAMGTYIGPARVARTLGGQPGLEEINLQVECWNGGGSPRLISFRMRRMAENWKWEMPPSQVEAALKSLNDALAGRRRGPK